MKGRSSSWAAPHSRALDGLTALAGSVRRTIAHFRYQRVSLAQATDVVVLFTPDEARLREDLQGADEPDCERDLSPQAPQRPLRGRNGAWPASRPNSAVGTGVNSGRSATSTGRHVVRLDGTEAPLRDIARRLSTAGCEVDDWGDDWAPPDRFPEP